MSLLRGLEFKMFEIVKGVGINGGMQFDSYTLFYDDKGCVEAQYFYNKGKCNYLLSWGFTKGSLGELRKSKAHKVKKPYFNLTKGWFGE